MNDDIIAVWWLLLFFMKMGMSLLIFLIGFNRRITSMKVSGAIGSIFLGVVFWRDVLVWHGFLTDTEEASRFFTSVAVFFTGCIEWLGVKEARVIPEEDGDYHAWW